MKTFKLKVLKVVAAFSFMGFMAVGYAMACSITCGSTNYSCSGSCDVQFGEILECNDSGNVYGCEGGAVVLMFNMDDIYD